MHNTRNDIQHLKVLIEEKIQHTYLEKYIQKPFIDEEKLLILNAILNDILPRTKKEQYIVITMLVQIALDTHDLVPETIQSENSATKKTTNQLTVLAGDYYSGLYYLLLSEIDDIKMISTLASAIKKINELKMKLYFNEFDTFDELINIILNIESLLIVHVAEFVNQTELVSLTKEWILTNKLIQEVNNLDQDSSSLVNKWELFVKNGTSKSNSVDIEDVTKKHIVNTKRLLSQLSDRHTVLNSHLTTVLNEYSSNKTSIVEEG